MYNIIMKKGHKRVLFFCKLRKRDKNLDFILIMVVVYIGIM